MRSTSEMAAAKMIFLDRAYLNVPAQNGIVKMVERYATSLRRVFVAYALDPGSR